MNNEELVKLYKKTGDKKYLEELCNKNIDFVHKLAHKFRNTCQIPFEDLKSAGIEGFLTAIQKADPAKLKKNKFLTYAYFWVWAKIIYTIRSSSIVHMPESAYWKGEHKKINFEPIEIFLNSPQNIVFLDLEKISILSYLIEKYEKELSLKEDINILKNYYGIETPILSLEEIEIKYNLTAPQIKNRLKKIINLLKKFYKERSYE